MPRSGRFLLPMHGVCHRALKCDIIILQTFPFEPLKSHHAIHAAAVEICAKFQLASINESEDRDV